MIRDKITRWVPLVTIVICGLLIAGVVVAQPGGWGGGHGKMGSGMGCGKFDGHGMGKGAGAMMFLGPGGLFADEEIQNLKAEIKILGFINKFEFTAEQLRQIASLSAEALDATSEIAEQSKGLILDKLHNRRDALLRGERPDEFKHPEEPMIPEGMKEHAGEIKEIMKGITDEFLNILNDEQRTMLEENRRSHFGSGADESSPGEHGGPGTGFHGEMKCEPEMMIKMKIIGILLNPRTVDIIHEKMNYL